MPKIDDKMSFTDWHHMASNMTFKIIRKRLYQTKLPVQDLVDMHNKGYHPYFAAVKAVLNSEEFDKGDIYESFVIAKANGLCIVRVVKQQKS